MTRSRRFPAIDSARLIRWYDAQARIYRLWRNDFDSPLLDEVTASLLDEGAPRRLLDAGCGTGLLAVGLARRLPDTLIEGVDASRGMIRVARKEAQRHGVEVEFHCGDVTALTFPDARFDTLVVGGLFPNLEDPGSALREMYRVLTRRGRLIVVEFDRSSMRWPTRFFFRVMILGYRIVSGIFRRFRFADQWNLETSTVDRPALEAEIRAAGFEIVRVDEAHQHLFFLAKRGPA